MRDGVLDLSAASAEKLVLGENLKTDLAKLAISELLQNGNCKKCGGTGFINSRPHDACGSTGKKKHSEMYNSGCCFIEYDAWMKTWRHRYRLVRNHLTDHLNSFEIHLEKHV